MSSVDTSVGWTSSASSALAALSMFGHERRHVHEMADRGAVGPVATMDVRCRSLMVQDSSSGQQGCQLYVGHEGTHARLALAAGERILRRWTSGPAGVDAPVAVVVDVAFGCEIPAQLPWAPGFPRAEHVEIVGPVLTARQAATAA